MSGQPLEIHVIADSTGDTAARLARAVQAQFSQHPLRVVRHPRVTTAEGLRLAFNVINRKEGTAVAVLSTLVDHGLSDLVAEMCVRLGIVHVDLLGPALAALEKATGDKAEGVPARPVGIDADYFKRIAAMEFAVKHDDGQTASALKEADIVLVGISRTGKTPLSMYLGYLGYKTANVPLVPGIAPPQQLYAVDRWKLVALTIDPQRLAAIRGKRVRSMGSRGRKDGYAELSKIYDEIDEVSVIHRRLGCPVIDTTAIALEEAAGRVIDLVDDRTRLARATSPSSTTSQRSTTSQ